VSKGSFPNYFVTKVHGLKNAVEQQFQIMTRNGVTVEIERSRWLENAVQFYESHRHHCEIGGHVIFAQETAQCLEQVGYGKA
jgi:hypothetical protein